MGKGPLVCVVDDDESVRESLPDLLREFGFEVCAFSSAEEFLVSDRAATCACLILDIAMPGMSGPELLTEWGRRGCNVPIVFITANADDGMRSRLLLRGAAECLFKPFSAAELLAALDVAMPAR
jgi:FixJ family two-component response regulator